MLHGPLDGRALHLVLELLHQHAVELLHVVLHEGVVRVPAKGLGQLLGADRRVRVLQLVEDALQRERDGGLGVLAVGRVHVVHGLPKVRQVRQRLEQRVHVARRALILESHIARLALRIPVPPVDLRLDAHARRDDDLVIDDEASARIAQLVQLHELAEAPVACAQREVVVGVLDDRFARVLLVLHCERKMGLPRPSLRQRD